MTPAMHALQYAVDGTMRVAVLHADGRSVDVSAGVDPGGGITAAVAAARRDGRSLHALLSDLSTACGEPVSVDLGAGVIYDGRRRQAIGVPVDAPEVWAAGVTYLKSREARELESGDDGRELYRRVYDAERPEVFLKDAGGRRTVAIDESIGIRGDSVWSVPEPEIGVVVDADGVIAGYTIGNDVSARDIEGDNPLYLPQAKIFAASCAIGPSLLVLPDEGQAQPIFELTLRILAPDGSLRYEGSTTTRAMRRSFAELISFVRRYNRVDDGTLILTGTGLVPPPDVALADGDVVEVEVPGLGLLRNPVRLLTP
jgi:2-dehydro-3-deoxy-D-arabinonate dehydratase